MRRIVARMTAVVCYLSDKAVGAMAVWRLAHIRWATGISTPAIPLLVIEKSVLHRMLEKH